MFRIRPVLRFLFFNPDFEEAAVHNQFTPQNWRKKSLVQIKPFGLSEGGGGGGGFKGRGHHRAEYSGPFMTSRRVGRTGGRTFLIRSLLINRLQENTGKDNLPHRGAFQESAKREHPCATPSERTHGAGGPTCLTCYRLRLRAEGHEVKCPIRGLFNTRVSAHEEQGGRG